MNIIFKKINEGLNYVAKLLWGTLIILNVIGLFYSTSKLANLFYALMILIGSLVLFNDYTINNLHKQIDELEDKNNKLRLQVMIKDLVNSGLK